MSVSAEPPRLDALWDELAPHVEWPEGFSLIFLFAGHPGPVQELRARLEANLQARSKTLRVLEPKSPKEAEELTPYVIAAADGDCGAMWLSLLAQAGNPRWTTALRELLQRLNERRFLLERDVHVPVLMVLPSEMRPEVYVLAPDLWTVRSFAQRVPELEISGSVMPPAPAAREAVMGPPGRAEVEWARLLSKSNRRGVAAADGLFAHESALERGDLDAARRIAKETLAVVLDPSASVIESLDELDVFEELERSQALEAVERRTLASVLEALGKVETHSGNLLDARELFRRAIQLREALLEDDPEDPRARRELAASFEGMGAAQPVDRDDLARHWFQRAVELRESLASDNPSDLQARHELAKTCEALSDTVLRSGNLFAATEALRRAVELREALADAESRDLVAQRDLSFSLKKLGLVRLIAFDFHSVRECCHSLFSRGRDALRLGNLSAAHSFLQSELELTEGLSKADKVDSYAELDLARSLLGLGKVELGAGWLSAARDRFLRASSINERFVKAHPRDATAQSGLMASLSLLGDVEARAGNLATAHDLLLRVCSINEALAKQSAYDSSEVARSLYRLGLVALQSSELSSARDFFLRASQYTKNERELALFLDRLGYVELRDGNTSAAQNLLSRALLMAEALATADSRYADVRRGLSGILNDIGKLLCQSGDLSTARDHFNRARFLAEAIASSEPLDANARRELAIAWDGLGGVEASANDPVASRSAYQRALDLREALCSIDPLDARAKFDVVESHHHLANLAAQQHDHATELDHLRRAAAILDTMATNGQLAGFADRERLREEITRRLAPSPAAGPTVDEPQPPSTPVPAQPDQPGAPPSPRSR